MSYSMLTWHAQIVAEKTLTSFQFKYARAKIDDIHVGNEHNGGLHKPI